MTKHKFAQVGLDAIDASLTEAEVIWGNSPGMEQACRELRAWGINITKAKARGIEVIE